MAGTFSKIYIQYVFAVQGRMNLLHKPWRLEVFKYISGIIEGKGQKSIIVNGVEDHVHALVGINPVVNISELVRDIKNNSSKFINKQKYFNGKFAWQSGYAVFSYSQSHVKKAYKYILDQEEHHRKRNFREEYIDLLQRFEIPFDEKYLFQEADS
ncbi:MAG: IS200/IS605 family transposase [Saprospiraceae bacterium]|nr:IS200/IS605 family transposase [Saprospiraceae bacterium]